MRMRALGTALITAALAVAGPAVPARAAEGTVLGTGAAGAITGRYVVTPKEPGSSYTVTMTATQARRLAADPAVSYVEQDRVLRPAGTQLNPSWGLDRIDQRAARGSRTFTPMDDGNSVHAYVLDTGIRITHTEFGGRASYGYDFVDGDATASDCNGHGTHVAGTIGGSHYGVAKKVRLVAVRVLDCAGQGTLSDVIAGVNWVTAHAVRPAVANMSMGGADSPSLEAAVQRSIAAGITYVVAAGNDDRNAAGVSPAGLAAAITVGATDSADRRAPFSNYGGVLDLFAPGVLIRSAVSSGDTATALYSGTSMASPHVAGAAAVVLDAYPTMTPARVRDYLVAKATTGRVTDLAGSPNRLLYVPQPPPRPAIATTTMTVRAGRAYAGRLALAASRRGWWSITAGSLPAGLKLAPDGTLTGTPIAPGTASVRVRFVDWVPYSVTRTLTVTVVRTTPVITTASLPAAWAGTGYAAQLTLADERRGTWSIAAGALPLGLALSASGRLSGTPSAPCAATVTVRFTDAWGSTATRTLTLTVE